MITDAVEPLPVSARNIEFHYANGPMVLDGFCLSVAAGERVCLLGENGSGKTTFALHLNGLLPIQAGEIKIGDVAVTEQHLTRIRRLVGSVFQDPDDQLFMNTVGDDVAFGPANLGIEGADRARRVSGALDAVGAQALADRTSHHLSGGEKRRAAIATVLSMEPAVLVLDEPTAGLDPKGKREITELLTSLPQTQLTITHDLVFATKVCDRAIVIANGSVAADGSVDEIVNDLPLLERYGLA